MQPRKPTKGQRPPQGPQGKKPQHWYPYHYCPPYYYDWYDYDYDYDYDWYDYDWNYLAPNKARNPGSPKPTDAWSDYQQGFKDGWKAAMDYMMYGVVEPVEPPFPAPTAPKPTEGTEE